MMLKNKLKISLGLLLLLALPGVHARAGSDFQTIDTKRLHRMIVDNAYKLEGGREKQFAVIDARPNEEYAQAHLFSAVSIPEQNFDTAKHLLPGDKGTLLVVYGENIELSRKWAARAAAAGYGNVVIYAEGYKIWKENKLPIAPIDDKR